jgi:prephenate dehydrogenase
MMLGVLQSNRENVLDTLHGVQSQLSEIESALSSNDFSRLESILNKSQQAYKILLNTDN